jgi:UDP-glucose 4-epimerase
MKILIIGGCGFFGWHLINHLKTKHKIVVLDNYERKYDKKFKVAISKNIKIINHDVSKKINLKDRDFDIIYNLAALIGVKNVIKRPYEVLVQNFLTQKNALEFAQKQKKLSRFIFSSTSEVYDGSLKNNLLKFPTKESNIISLHNDYNPRSSYMLSKIYGEYLCFFSKVPFVILRLHNVYGPRMGMRHVIPEIIKKIKSNKNKEIIIPNAHHSRTFCYVEDAVIASFKLAKSKKSINDVFNVGNQKNEITIIKLAKKIAKILNKKNTKFKVAVDKNHSPYRRKPDTKKMDKIDKRNNKKLSLDKGLKKTIDWYSENFSF